MTTPSPPAAPPTSRSISQAAAISGIDRPLPRVGLSPRSANSFVPRNKSRGFRKTPAPATRRSSRYTELLDSFRQLLQHLVRARRVNRSARGGEYLRDVGQARFPCL